MILILSLSICNEDACFSTFSFPLLQCFFGFKSSDFKECITYSFIFSSSVLSGQEDTETAGTGLGWGSCVPEQHGVLTEGK